MEKDNLSQERQRSILLLPSDQDTGENLIRWLREAGLAVRTVETAQEAFVALVNDVFDIFLLDMTRRSQTGVWLSEDAVSIVRMIRQDRRVLKSSLVVLMDRGDSLGLAQAVEAGADGFIVKPMEKIPFLRDIGRILKEAEFRRTAKKSVDINRMHSFWGLLEEGGREGFFALARIIFDKLILEKITPVLGDEVIIALMRRLQNVMEQKGCVFMKYACLSGRTVDGRQTGPSGGQSGLRLSMEEIETRFPDISTEDLAAGFRRFVYTFLEMVYVLTSEILIGRPFEILLVEDNPGDARLVEEALRDSAISYHVMAVKDGREAMELLRRQGSYAQASVPDLILLDLNLPGKDGRQILAEVKGDPFLRDIPVVIMTASAVDEAVLRSRGMTFDSYIVKPFDMRQFCWVIKTVESENFDALKEFGERGTVPNRSPWQGKGEDGEDESV